MSKHKQSSMDSFVINKSVTERDRWDTEWRRNDNSELVACSKKTAKVKKYRCSHESMINDILNMDLFGLSDLGVLFLAGVSMSRYTSL